MIHRPLRVLALLMAGLAAGCADYPSPEYRLGLFAENPDPFGEFIGPNDDIGLEEKADIFGGY